MLDKRDYYFMLFAGSTKHRLAAILATIGNVLDSESTDKEKLELIEIIKDAAITAEKGD